jgi:diguanylate cyclase (GGDEF)-like protein
VIARVMAAGIRAESLFCRFGGDEFAVLLAEVALEEAGSVAERLREAVAATEVPYKGAVIRVTLSLGAAELGARPDGESLIAAADRELYSAKRGGRNRVRLERPE